ncbi:MAG TPA: YciI family protein [Candidatus Baltobacteraceae bacterium]|jgi:uncharacterized protein YciI|nr:YciI family protein [Candidatus Baltobacteraceae bacterium]
MPYFVVIRDRGDAWDWSQPMRRQPRFAEHAAFMDALTEEGFILAGGPLGGEDDAARVLHVVNAPNEDAVRSRLNEDPWPLSMLQLASIERWTVLLGGFGAAR